ncbi:MAG: hypothetical protein KKA62_03460 [Nanoarchaeota archaeon]|nr:hypothetical protein [Nanoarchaeota archaeon]MBU1644581.1 hypothetical protein [Nanoarchaeota archaeon]MBU1976983.1 hypothetical protein [Nanoarchaeota archaeon]
MEKKKLKDKAKKALKISLLALGINQAALVVGLPTSLTFYSNILVRLKVDDEKLKPYNHLPKDLNTLDYLIISTSIVHHLAKGEGDCKDYSNATFDVYEKLTNINGRTELKNKVRFAAGQMKEGVGHLQLEFEDFGKFIPFEATSNGWPLSISYIKYFSELARENPDEGLNTVVSRSLPGHKWFYPSAKSYYYPGGLVVMASKGVVSLYEKLSKSD